MMAFADLASYSQQRGTAKKKPRGKKGVCFAEPSTGRPRPDVGLLILLRIINNPKNMKMMMFKNRQQLQGGSGSRDLGAIAGSQDLGQAATTRDLSTVSGNRDLSSLRSLVRICKASDGAGRMRSCRRRSMI